jgi:hypothetical protein
MAPSREKQIADLEAKGDTVKGVEVNPTEFREYCDRMRYNYDIVALRNFVVWKGE